MDGDYLYIRNEPNGATDPSGGPEVVSTNRSAGGFLRRAQLAGGALARRGRVTAASRKGGPGHDYSVEDFIWDTIMLPVSLINGAPPDTMLGKVQDAAKEVASKDIPNAIEGGVDAARKLPGAVARAGRYYGRKFGQAEKGLDEYYNRLANILGGNDPYSGKAMAPDPGTPLGQMVGSLLVEGGPYDEHLWGNYGLGVSITLIPDNAGPAFTFGSQVVFDRCGNVGLAVYGGIGVGLLRSASIGLDSTVFNDLDHVCQLAGLGFQIGGGGAAYGGALAVEKVGAIGSPVSGTNYSVGFGTPGVDVWGLITVTGVYALNSWECCMGVRPDTCKKK